WIRFARAFRKDARPGNREAVGVGADVLHQRDIFLVAVIVVVGDVAVVVVLYIPRYVGVGIPDRFALAFLVPTRFDVVRRRANAPVNPSWELSAVSIRPASVRTLELVRRPTTGFSSDASRRRS